MGSYDPSGVHSLMGSAANGPALFYAVCFESPHFTPDVTLVIPV